MQYIAAQRQATALPLRKVQKHSAAGSPKTGIPLYTDGYYQALKKIFEEMVEVGFSEKEDFKRVLVSADLDEIERFIEQ